MFLQYYRVGNFFSPRHSVEIAISAGESQIRVIGVDGDGAIVITGLCRLYDTIGIANPNVDQIGNHVEAAVRWTLISCTLIDAEK